MEASVFDWKYFARVVSALAVVIASQAVAASSGPYSSSYYTVPDLVNHTIIAPTNPPANVKLPVLIWGQTGCTYNSLVFQTFLQEVASHGIFVISNGLPNGPNNPNGVSDTHHPNGTLHRVALDWVYQQAGINGTRYQNVVKDRIAVAGQSCGGMQAFELYNDPRVTTIGIFNSGEQERTKKASQTTKPIFYFLGGSTDIAYTNGEFDYSQLPTTTPRWKGNIPLGHGGDYSKANGGKFGAAAVAWLRWVLRGDTSASNFFTGSGSGTAKGTGWTTVSGSLDMIRTTPL